MTSSPVALLRTETLTLYSPLSLPVHMLALELVFVICAGIALRHALLLHRRGDPKPLFVWLCTLAYGLMIEILSYNFLDNFTHGQFTVMLYHRRLPLYIAILYPVFQYTSIELVRGARLRLWCEPFLIGLVIVAMDFPYDISGPDAGWWTWSAKDPNLSYRWHGVPVTSYYWHLAFGGALAFLARVLGRWAAPAPVNSLLAALRMVALAVVVGVLTLVLGVVAFLPFHFLKAHGVSDGALVAGLLIIAAGVSALGLRRPQERVAPERSLALIPMLYAALHLTVALWIYLGGSESDPAALGKFAVKLLAAVALVIFVAWRYRVTARLPVQVQPSV